MNPEQRYPTKNHPPLWWHYKVFYYLYAVHFTSDFCINCMANYVDYHKFQTWLRPKTTVILMYHCQRQSTKFSWWHDRNHRKEKRKTPINSIISSFGRLISFQNARETAKGLLFGTRYCFLEGKWNLRMVDSKPMKANIMWLQKRTVYIWRLGITEIKVSPVFFSGHKSMCRNKYTHIDFSRQELMKSTANIFDHKLALP